MVEETLAVLLGVPYLMLNSDHMKLNKFAKVAMAIIRKSRARSLRLQHKQLQSFKNAD